MFFFPRKFKIFFSKCHKIKKFLLQDLSNFWTKRCVYNCNGKKRFRSSENIFEMFSTMQFLSLYFLFSSHSAEDETFFFSFQFPCLASDADATSAALNSTAINFTW
jgi:hypothetical protein